MAGLPMSSDSNGAPVQGDILAQEAAQAQQTAQQPITAAAPTTDAAAPAAKPSGGGGLFGWIDHAAAAVSGAVGKVVSKIPGAPAVTGFMNRAYTDIISHPLSTLIHVQNQANFDARNPLDIGHLLKKSTWTDAWQASNHISPGQEVVLGVNNVFAGNNAIDPNNQQAVDALFRTNSIASLTSGTMDGALRYYTDPVGKLAQKGGEAAAGLKNAPVKAGAPVDLASRGTQRLINQVAQAKTMTQVSKIKAVRDSPVQYQLAQVLHAAGGDTSKIGEIIKVATGDNSALDNLAKDTATLQAVKNAGAGPADLTLHDNLPAVQSTNGMLVAMRASSVLDPAEVTMKSALTDMDPAALDDWFKNGPATAKAAHAQLVIDDQIALLDTYQQLAGSLMHRTTGDLGLHPASFKAQMTLSSRPLTGLASDIVHNPTTMVQQIISHSADPVIRIYHTLTDQRPTNLINFSEDGSVQQIRSFLNKSSVLDQATKDSMLQKYAAALPRGKAAAQHAWIEIEKDAKSLTVQHFGLDASHGDAVYQEFAARRGLNMQGVTSRAYGALKGPDGEDWGSIIPTHDYSEVITDPYLETQLAGGAVPYANLSDYELALRRMQESGLLSHVHSMGDKGHAVLVDSLDRFYGVFKPVVMLTGHRAFNHVGDDALRAMTKIGALATVRNAVGGVENFIKNRFSGLTKGMVAHNLEGKWQADVLKAETDYKALRSRYVDQQQKLANGEPVDVNNMIRAEDVSKAKNGLDIVKTSEPSYIQMKHRLGEGTFKVKGTNVQYPEIFGGPDGQYLRTLLSADRSFSEMFDKSAVSDYNTQGMLADHDVIGPRDGVKVHGNAIIRYVNNQLRNDTVAKMLYAGKTDAEISQWMMNSAAGRARMNAMHIGNPADNIEMVRDSLNRYLPTPAAKEAAFTGKYSAETLQQVWPNDAARPPVSGNMALLTHVGTHRTAYIRSASEKMIKLTGSLPDDILVRHPLANDLYKTNFTRLVENHAAQGTEVPLGSELYNTVHRQAITATKKTMQQTLYDSSRFVGAGQALRFVIPFFNAWHNAMQSWSHLIVQNPQLVVRGLEAKHSLWNAPFAVDTATGEQANDKTGLDDLSFIMHMPKGLAKSLGMGDMSDIAIGAKTVVSPTYADAVGNPGFGPLVQVPLNHMVKEDPSLMANPFIAQILGDRVMGNDLQSAIPSAATQLLDAAGMAGIVGQPDDVQSRASLKWTLYQEQYYDYMAGKRSTPPNWNDISSQASWLNGISSIVNRFMPLGFKPQDPYKFLTDAYQQMYDQDPAHADENFYDKYGATGWIYTQSLGKNVAGVAPTLGAVEAYKANESLVKQHPELGSVIVGPNGDGSFNDMAYQWEVAMGLRTKMSPEDAAKEAQTNLGWVEFNKINANIQVQLQQRGLTSVNQDGAEDLKTLKASFTNATGNPNSKYYNPDFYNSYGSFDQNSYETRIQSLGKIAQDPTLLANPLRSDIKSLNQWFQLRDQVYAALQTRNSKTITAKENTDIAQYYDYAIGLLKSADTKFGPLYERYLAKDNFKQPN